MNKFSKPLYFDTAATSAVHPEVLARMIEVLTGLDANPSSIHNLGQAAANIVATARSQVAAELGCESDEIVFTSGATEANNLALQGVALAYGRQGRHLVTSSMEHKSVLGSCAALQEKGYEVTYVTPNRNGWVEPESVARAIRSDTLLVSLQHTNNETGVMQAIAEVADLVAQEGVLFHVDAAQAAGKFAIDLQKIPIDLLSLSAHKFHGPKGVGCLAIRSRRHVRLEPLMYGGGQEFGLRPGTLATHQIVGLSAALALASERRAVDLAHVHDLKRQFLQKLGERLPLQIHGELALSSPYIVNFSIPGISGDALINQTSSELAIASGAACSSGTVEPSHVLRAMGMEGEVLYGAVRVSFSRDHDCADIDAAVERISAAVGRMRELKAC